MTEQTPKQVLAGIAERFLDKPGPAMLAAEIIKKLDAAGYAIVQKPVGAELFRKSVADGEPLHTKEG